MSSPPTFGLLVPCHNGARFLPRLFASAQAQTRPFDEVWLFDDGSSDDSAAVAATFGARVLRSERSLGPSAARNRLTQACTCTWLHYHDADDTMAPHYLERVAAEAASDVDLVVCDMVWVDEETGAVDNRWRYDGTALAQDGLAYLVTNTIGGINGLYRRDTLQRAGGFNEGMRYWEDTELNLRLCRHRAKARVVSEDLVTAFRRRTSYSNSNLGEVWRTKLTLIRTLLPGADAHLRATIAVEAENIANRLGALGLWRDVAPALALNREAGGRAPTTRSRALRAVGRVLPGTAALWLQHHLRRLLRNP